MIEREAKEVSGPGDVGSGLESSAPIEDEPVVEPKEIPVESEKEVDALDREIAIMRSPEEESIFDKVWSWMKGIFG